MRRFARAVLPAQLIAVSSSSSLASLPALIEGAERTLGLPARVTGFVLPLAVSTFKLAAPVSWTVGALFVGWFYTSISTRVSRNGRRRGDLPRVRGAGVPRGAFLMLTPLFLAIGLPAEGIGLLIAVGRDSRCVLHPAQRDRGHGGGGVGGSWPHRRIRWWTPAPPPATSRRLTRAKPKRQR